MTKIEWATKTWNPLTGCSKVSEGCKNCYAFKTHDRRHKGFLNGNLQNIKQYAKPFNEIQLFPERLKQPLSWKKPQRIFVNSMSDLFHKDIPFKFIDQVFAVIALTPRHTYQILTKRPERMLQYFQSVSRAEMIECWVEAAYELTKDNEAACFVANRLNGVLPNTKPGWPVQNAWLGTSVENQKAADERIPLLLQTPAAVRFLSCEPLLGPVDLKLNDSVLYHTSGWWPPISEYTRVGECIDWVICGGESGPSARPMHPDWARSLRDQCAAFDIPYFFKQWGTWLPGVKMPKQPDVNYDIYQMQNSEFGRIVTGHWWDEETVSVKVGKKKAGRLLDGQEWSRFPETKCQGGEYSCSK